MSSPASYIAYYRVSTQQQGRSGLGLDAQRESVRGYLLASGGALVHEYTEMETGKGANALDRRPQLRAALAHCKQAGATLILAKHDRLARNVHFVTGLIESGVDFKAADMPQATKTMIQMYAVMSEWERDQISERTKAALAAAKARGVRLGAKGANNVRELNSDRVGKAVDHAETLREQFDAFRVAGYSQRRIADLLNRAGLRTRAGCAWTQKQVQRVQARLEARR